MYPVHLPGTQTFVSSHYHPVTEQYPLKGQSYPTILDTRIAQYHPSPPIFLSRRLETPTLLPLHPFPLSVFCFLYVPFFPFFF